MKKILLFLTILSFNSFADNVEAFLEYNLSKKIEFKNGMRLNKEEKDFGINLEFYSPPNGKNQGGFGIIHNKIKLKEAQELNMTTYYLVNKYYFNNSKLSTYGKLQGGAYYPSTILDKSNITKPYVVSLDKGYFYGFALGIQYGSYMIQSFYKSYNGKSNLDGIDTKFQYETINLALGYNFGI